MPAFVACGLARCGELAQRQRRMAEAELCGLPQRLGQRLQLSRGAEAARGLELALGGAGGADEVRVVGVREPIRLGAHLGDDAPLLEREHRVDDAGGEEVALDLLPALGVRAGVCRALLHLQLHAVDRRDAAQEEAPATVGVRTSRCGDRGPVSEPPPRNAPRR